MSKDQAQDDSPYTLDKFNSEIVRPMILNGIANGKFDTGLLSDWPNMISMYSCDLEMVKAIIARLDIILKD